MDVEAVIERVRRVATARAADDAGIESIEAALTAEREVRAWLDAAKAQLVAAVARTSSFPEATIAERSRCSLNDAAKDKERADTLDSAPGFAGALDDASITAGHVDALTRGSKQLTGEQRDEFFDRASSLIDAATTSTVERFGRKVRNLVNSILADGGEDRLVRQKRAMTLSTWTDGEPSVEWAIPVELPARVIAGLAADADIHGVVVRNGVVLYAPGKLNLGRTTRLANRAQRRALRGLYATCAIPGCATHYDRCKLHHVIWWRHGGRTDLDNLLPLCSRHHHKVHDDGWSLTLGPNRELTVTLPDGAVRNTGPPTRRAA